MLRIRTILPVVSLLTLLTVSPVLAGSGLPQIATLQAGPHVAALHNDSFGLRTGSNTLTVEIPGLRPGHQVALRLVGPQGQVIQAQLAPVARMGGAAEEHGGHGAAATPPAPAMDHSSHSGTSSTPAPAMDHSSHGASTTGTENHGSESSHDTGDSYLGRAEVNLPTGGHWKAILEIRMEGETMTDAAEFDVTYGGPNKLYLGATGSLMGGFILTGIIRRRRSAGGR